MYGDCIGDNKLKQKNLPLMLVLIVKPLQVLELSDCLYPLPQPLSGHQPCVVE